MIRLLVFDIDGVLTDGETKTIDLSLMAQLAAMNRAARRDPALPAVTICTGRPAPYVEMMLQAIDGHLPGIFENGAGLYVPDGYRFLSHPDLGDGAAMAAVRRRLRETMLQSGQAYFQPGKEFSLSLFASDPAATDALYEQTLALLGPLAESVNLVRSPSCLNIVPRHIDKGRGIHFLAGHTGHDPAQMLGAGDSDGDLPFLALVGYKAAPANANQAVREAVDFVAPRPAAGGVRDILAHFRHYWP
jgi:hydroxymethylpyrimidine pyrophosphatase-like HAD family hydrolase